MTKSQLEKYIAAFLFIAVVIAFSYAEKESKKIQVLYTATKLHNNTPLAIKPNAVSQTIK
ncbi:hypothetical protein [Flavisolibacter tropicus]|uniref:Uncharacterized protein n=1 Tax=Flavisolibacter tropicus TaxID=1492898 RepID=A0A172TTQ5_9BACT|nr:hypothetical protein [Flavisolibacter tropicus]ANE50491.1 hypothetical protein SY85_08270 [Flavisolibacter tropicus]